MSGTLWICATPIGNLGDVSYRLLETLEKAHLIAAEDTRVTHKLLERYTLKKHLISLQKYNEAQRIELILKHLSQGEDVALVSDAGTPNIADPGAFLVEKVREAGFKISPIPGPSAVTAFLSVSGVTTPPFFFGGFFPKKAKDALTLLDQCPAGVPFIAFEAGPRILDTITTLATLRPLTHLVLGKELTKVFETILAGPPDTVLSQLKTTSPKGEWIFLAQWAAPPTPPTTEIVDKLQALGLTKRQILDVACSVLNYPKNEVYHVIHHD